MDNIVIILWFSFVFFLVLGVLYSFLLRDKNYEKRLNYYLDINKGYEKIGGKKGRLERNKSLLKRSDEFIRRKLKGELSSENKQVINEMLMAAGVNLKPEEYIMLRWLLVIIAGGVFYLISSNFFILVLGAVVGYIFPKVWIKSKRKKRLEKFDEGLQDMINTIIGSLRAGFSFPQAMKTVSEECESPIKEEISRVLSELSYGLTMEEALDNLYNRMPSDDLELMIQATLVQRQVGGNLSNILEVIVNTIRERYKLNRQIRTLTAQGRLSGKIIAALPVALGFILYLSNPQSMKDFLGNLIGQIAISIGVVSGVIGFIIINKITKIEV